MRFPVLLLLAGCAAAPPSSRGVEVRLVLLDPAPVVGGPLRDRLEPANPGP